MDEDELRERISEWEDFRTEFVETISRKNADEISKFVVGFANSEGGDIIAGLNTKREIVGIKDANAALKVLDEIVGRKCEPPVTVYPKTMFMDGRTILVVTVAKGLRKPYRTVRGTYYLRTGSKIRPAVRDELISFFQTPKSHYYNENPIFGSTMDDLDAKAFGDFMERCHGIKIDSSNLEHHLMNLKLAEDGHLTVAGSLMFGKDPRRFTPYSAIGVFSFAGNDHSTSPQWWEEISGTVPHMLDAAMAKVAPGADAIGVPLPALREAITNALVHREYTISAPVKVSIFSDRIEVKNPGPLKPPVNVESALMGMRSLRNPLLFSLVGMLAEKSGRVSGMKHIARELKAATGHHIRLHMNYDEFTIVLPGREFVPDDHEDEFDETHFDWGA